jgi:LysM repeat protein
VINYPGCIKASKRRVMKKGLKCAIVVVIMVLVSTLAMAAKFSTGTKSTPRVLELQEIWYKVVTGDNLYRIAKNHGTSVQNIKFYNKGARGKYIHPGQKFRIIVPIIHQKPVLRETKTIKQIASKKESIKTIKPKVATKKIRKKVVVASKDSDDEKASRKARMIKRLAKQVNAKSVKATAKNTTKSTDVNQKSFYVVKKGDVLGRISKRTNVSQKNLRLWNTLNAKSKIVIGQKLRITKPRFYKVVKNDNLGRISGKTGVPVPMLKYYNKKMRRIIRPGDIVFLDKDVFIPYSLRSQEKRIGTRKMKRYAQYIDLAYQKYGVDRNLIAAVMKVESYFNSSVKSHKGAYGLMQLMAETAHDMKVNRYDELQNVMGGAKYLALLIDKYDGNLDKTLAGYNAGPGNVAKYKGIPPFKETRNYVTKVKATYRKSVKKMLQT